MHEVFFSNVICIASHMLWLRFIPPSIALTCWFALWPVRHLSPQTPKVLKEMLNTNLESGFNWRCWIEKYRTRAICSNACSLWESKLNCENNGSTDQILVLPSSPIGVRQCHVMAWSFSSFPPKTCCSLSNMLGWGPISQYILERTPLAYEIYACDRNQRVRHLHQVGKIAASVMHCLCCRACEKKNVLDFGTCYSVPQMHSSVVRGKWTQSNR